jgi:beta-lactamase class A
MIHPNPTLRDYYRQYLIPLILLLASLLLPGAQVSARDDLAPTQDPQLQAKLNQLVDREGWGPLIDNRSMAIALVLLQENGYRLAMLNGAHMVYAASLPKIAILFSAMVASQEGALQIDAALEQDLHDMIRVSCNPCATRAMEKVGREHLLEILQRPEYGFYDEDLYGGLWVGKDYGASPAHKRDPLRGLSHGASAYQVARIYYQLYRGTLLDEKHSAMMRDMLARPGIEHKFVRGLAGEEGLELWRKSGSWKQFHADSVLVQWRGTDYILVGLIEGVEGDRQLEQLAREAHKLVSSL